MKFGREFGREFDREFGREFGSCGAGFLVKPLDLCCEVSELYLCLRLSSIVLKSWSYFR
jgi:hypothetical protein